MVDFANKRFGRIDILVNNAGIWEEAAIDRMTEEQLRRTLETNINGVFYTITAVAPQMIQQQSGNIINISSTAGQRGEAYHAHYAASKGATHSLTKTLAKELMPHHINVNAIVPGTVETDINRHMVSDPEWRAAAIARCPMGIGSVDDIAPAAVYLASEETDWIKQIQNFTELEIPFM